MFSGGGSLIRGKGPGIGMEPRVNTYCVGMAASPDLCHAPLPFPDPHMLTKHSTSIKQIVSICTTLNGTRYSVGDPAPPPKKKHTHTQQNTMFVL